MFSREPLGVRGWLSGLGRLWAKVLKAQMPFLSLLAFGALSVLADSRPNILFCSSDDQSYAHTGANGDPVVKTPAFDRVALQR